MDRTPQLRSAFPATPSSNRRFAQHGDLSQLKRTSQPLPQVSPIQSTSSPSNEPLIPEHILDPPTQRLWAATLWVALWSWKVYDFWNLQELEEQSLWLFMKWIAIDGIFLFGLPSLRIPWLEWSPFMITLLFGSHAVADFMMMFRIAIPVGAAFAASGRMVWGAYELAVNEHNVNPETIRFNESLILGRQVIHILPEGSAILNPGREPYCIDGTRTEARLPIVINATNPISMDLIRIDLTTHANETLHIGKKELKAMHKEASRLLTYSDKPNEPKTLYYPVKKSGLYYLSKVMDESNLEVARKRMAHTVVVPCPQAAVKPSLSDRCKGELSNVELEVVGTPPLRLKYRKMVNHITQDATFESIQPEDFVTPLAKADQTALVVPNRIDVAWARPQKVSVSLSESLNTGGKWVYSIEEVKDGFGNTVSYTEKDHEKQERHKAKYSNLHQVVTVHERPTVNIQGCSPQSPLKIANGASTHLPIQISLPGRGEAVESAYHLEYMFSPQSDTNAMDRQIQPLVPVQVTLKTAKEQPSIQQPGVYTLTAVSSDFCAGEVIEPASCLLQNPPQPQLSIVKEDIVGKCGGSPMGLRVDLDLLGTPPFEVHYNVHRSGDRHHTNEVEKVRGLRGQIELTPKQAGDYTYEFTDISDAIYKKQPLEKIRLQQSVKPAASAHFTSTQQKKVACMDDTAAYDVSLQGEGPFDLEYELVHAGSRVRYTIDKIRGSQAHIKTDHLRSGGDYTLALVSVTDGNNCKEFLKDEVKITVRQQKPRVGFGHLEGRRSIETLEDRKVHLPLRLAGEGPWTVKYADQHGKQHELRAYNPNDRITVTEAGTYQLIDVRDAFCPGSVDEQAKDFAVSWIPRPKYIIAPGDTLKRSGDTFIKDDICEGDNDAVEVTFEGSPPYLVQYSEAVKLDKGTAAPRNKELRAALGSASMRLSSSQAGAYEYKFSKLDDNNYDHSPKHFTPLTVQQRVNARPSVAFTSPGKTYSYCSVESDGEEVVPITLHGAPPFEVEYEIKHHGTMKPETVSLTASGLLHDIRIPHRSIHLGKSAVILRRVSDSRGCSRILDSSTPRVQISVHDAPTISPMESHEDFCVGDRINFQLSGLAPFTVIYDFEGRTRKAIASSTTFRRLAEKPGNFTVLGIQDSASQCRTAVTIPKRIHGMPSVRVSKGRESYVDIHEGGEAEILFEFGGVPPFEFTYTRSSNTEKGGKKGVVLDIRSEVSQEHSLRIRASEEGTYEVVAIKDRYCSYAKPGVKLGGAQKLLTN